MVKIKAMDVPMDCVVSGALAVVLRVSRYVGIAPLRFTKKDNGWRIRLAGGWTVYGYLCAITIMLMAIIPFISNNIFIVMRINMSVAASIVCAYFVLLLAVTVIFSAPGRMTSMIVCLQHAQKINDKLNIHHKPMFPDKKKILVFTLIMITAFALNCAQYVQQMMTTIKMRHKIWIYVLQYINWWSIWIIEMYKLQFTTLTMHVMETFKAINDGLRDLLHATADQNIQLSLTFDYRLSKINKKSDNVVTRFPNFGVTKLDGISDIACPPHELARRLARAYTAACDVVREVDRTHGPILLLVLGLFLFQLVLTLHSFIIDDLLDVNAAFNLHLLKGLLDLSWCFYCTASLMLVIEPCHLTQVEMETTQELVSHLMRESHSSYYFLAMELELFFRNLILNEASYSPLQVMKLSRSLILTIFSSVTTYLVIIINP